MGRLVGLASLVLACSAAAQPFQDMLVQTPELGAPQRGSLAGQYARTAFGPADVSRGGFSLAGPFAVPGDRGGLLAEVFPTYSPDAGASEWGQGWQATLALTRFRAIGDIDFANDDLTGPWGRMVRGADGRWYPLGLKSPVRVEMQGDTLVAYLPDGSRWTFGGTARIQTARGTYSWHLTQVETATGRRTRLTWQANASGRLFLSSVSFGGVGDDFQYRLDFLYEAVATPFVDFRSGAGLALDRRVSQVEVLAKHATTGSWGLRWRYVLGYEHEGLGPAFYLASVQQVFASGELAPAVTYEYEHAVERLATTELRSIPKFDAVLWNYSDGVAQPGESAALDQGDDGLVDLESRSDFSLIRQQPGGYQFEPLPPPAPDARPECRPDAWSATSPRRLARMRPDSDTWHVFTLNYNAYVGQTEVLVCSRDGRPVHQEWVADAWQLGPNTRLVDLNRDRQPDVVNVFQGGYRVLPNVSTAASYAFGAVVSGSLSLEFEPQATWVHDFNGDTLADLVLRSGDDLFVYLGRGQLQFEEVPQVYAARFPDGSPVSLSGFDLAFVDANRDGLEDLVASSWDGLLLLVNDGTQLVFHPVPALEGMGANAGFPVVYDLEGTGNTEVFFVRNGLSHSVALDMPGTGLMKAADDGKGTRLTFSYARSPAEEGQGARQPLLDRLTVKSSGQDLVTYTYSYAEPKVHSIGGFLLGYANVVRQDAHVTQEMEFLHEDRFVGVLKSARTLDANSPQVEAFETHEYEDASFQGIAWKRPLAEERGWRSADGTQSTSERTEYLAYEADICPAKWVRQTAQGSLTVEKVRASVPGFGSSLHCLERQIIKTGSHPDKALDFRHELQVERNAVGLVTALRSVTPSNTLLLQQVRYAPDWTVAEVSSPGRGSAFFEYAPGTQLLRSVTASDGVVTRAAVRDSLTDAILALEVDRGSLRYLQEFRFDGQERLASRWDSLGGDKYQPKEIFTYRYATATTPAAVLASTLVDGRTGAARDTVGYVTAAGDGVTQARRIPQGWVFDGVVQRTAAGAESRTWMRATMDGSVDVLSLDYASLLAEAQQVGFVRTSTFGHTAASSSTFHEGVEQELATSLGIQAGMLTQTVEENSAFRTHRTLDASKKQVAYEDEAGNRYGYRYDALDRLREVTLPDGLKHRVQYDGHGRVAVLEREGIARVEYVYDGTTGLTSLKRFTSPSGAMQRQVAFTYDAMGRLATETHSDSSGNAPHVYRYWHDGASPSNPGARTARGFVTAVEGNGYLKLVDYRADGRPSRRILQLNGWQTIETFLTYSDDGAVASETTQLKSPDGITLAISDKEYRWNTYGQLSEVWVNGQQLSVVGYDAQGLATTATFTSGGSVTLGYDPLTRQRVSIAQVGPGWSSYADLRRNARGLVESESLSVGSKNLRREYGYSAQRFLTSASDAESTYAYAFDSTGLPTSIEENGKRRDLVSQGKTLIVDGVVYTFDDLGRTTSRGDLAFTYGPNGHVATAVRGGRTWEFLYDENGQRLLKRENGNVVAAYLDGGGYVDESGLIEPFRFAGQVVAVLRNGAFEMVATDLRGTVIAEKDGAARLASPFGHRSMHPDLAAVLDYVQKGYDADLDLIRMGVRDYDPALNRFLTPDPVFLEEPWRCVDSPVECNLYGYAANNPALYADPTGQWIESAIDIASLGVGIYSISQWNEKTSTLDKVLDVVGVGLDGVALALPLVPGGASAALKLLRGGDRAVDAMKAADKAGDVAKLAGKSDEAADALKAAKECAGGDCKLPGQCFVAGTPVLTEEGVKPIEELQEGDLVWSRDPVTGETSLKPVVQTFVTPQAQVLKLELTAEDGTTSVLGVTAEHPFWAQGLGWVGAASLLPGQQVASAHGGWLRVGSTTWEQARTTVYNFEVAGFHTYFVGTVGAWVHNMCTPTNPADAAKTAPNAAAPAKAAPDQWSRTPKSLQDQMALEAAQKGAGTKIIDNLGDPRFKGMEKWEYKVKSANGADSVVHYVRDPATGQLMDFKFKKHSTPK